MRSMSKVLFVLLIVMLVMLIGCSSNAEGEVIATVEPPHHTGVDSDYFNDKEVVRKEEWKVRYVEDEEYPFVLQEGAMIYASASQFGSGKYHEVTAQEATLLDYSAVMIDGYCVLDPQGNVINNWYQDGVKTDGYLTAAEGDNTCMVHVKNSKVALGWTYATWLDKNVYEEEYLDVTFDIIPKESKN